MKSSLDEVDRVDVASEVRFSLSMDTVGLLVSHVADMLLTFLLV
jgi:hypothetical protein